MAKAFDPYYKWLAIPPKDQPPNYYRLLGVERFESDLDVIESAADQRMAHVRSFQTGQNSALSQQILNELAAARVCLLSPEKKARYDATLRAQQPDDRLPATPAEKAEPPPLVVPSRTTTATARRRQTLPRWLLPAGAATLLILLAALLLLVRGGKQPPTLVTSSENKAKSSSPGKKLTSVKQPSQATSDKKDDARFSLHLAPGVEMRFVPIPASEDGRVRPFYLGETEVTQAQWSALMSDQPNNSTLPHVGIKHGDAIAFCHRLSTSAAAGGRRFRLPTRDEFIQAYGDLSSYTSEQVWSAENGEERVHAVATRQPGPHGVFDLVGNVWEWSSDGRFYGMSASDSLQRLFLAYSSIPLPGDYHGTTADYTAGNLGMRLAYDDDRPPLEAPPPKESQVAVVESSEPRESVLKRLFAEPLTLPDVPGVTADRLLIWNQHHGAANDAGARELAVTLFARGQEVWRAPAVPIHWATDQDAFIDLEPPDVPFDRLRAEVAQIVGQRGGLAEIEVFRGTTNLARGCPAGTAAPIDAHFPPAAVSDGIVSQTGSELEGYWLLPEKNTGWVDVDLSFAAPRPCRGVVADRVVVCNQHNGMSGDRGTTVFNVALVADGKELWRREKIELPWSADDDPKADVALPPLRFDRLRIETTQWHGLGGGLSEVEIWQGDRNLALACPVVASSYHMQMHRAANVTDGIASSREAGSFWLLPDNVPGWVEIDLSANDPAIGEANGRLGAYRALVEDDWPLGLAWLSRSSDAELRLLARRDVDGGNDARSLVERGDGWWEVAQAIAGQPRERLLTRGVRRYAQALSGLPADEQDRVRRRRDQILPSLAERRYLYFIEEAESQLIEGHEYQLRTKPVVVAGKASPNGLWLHPPGSGEAWARFPLPGGQHRFRGAVGINDSADKPASPVVFSISGDGRVLWTSQPQGERGASEAFDIDVSGVSSLQLTAAVAGPANWCHAVWIEPRLEIVQLEE
ncbi:MAG TPA: NPCBM/NEW2 domain-containing protein [Pirellulales bacterium]|nr:NPCBM/NEW2 domain-containing protein [Pirellulales bacterium]